MTEGTQPGTGLANFKTDQGALVPTTLAEAMELSRLLAGSQVVPSSYNGKPGNVFAAIQMGATLGLHPMQALQSIAVVNGQPSLWGDGMLAVCRAHPEWGGIEETGDGESATCTVVRHERTAAGVSSSTTTRKFSIADATQAGLVQRAQEKGGPWKDYPQRMLQMRARAWALRDAFADALRGIKSAEEARDRPPIDVEASVVSGKAAIAAALTPDATPAAKAAEPEQYTAQQEATADEAIQFIQDASADQLKTTDWKPIEALPEGLRTEVRQALTKRKAQLKAASEAGADPQTGEVSQ